MELLNEYFRHFVAVMPKLLDGAIITVQATAISVFFGLVLGLFICLSRMSRFKILSFPALAYIDIVRGTPLLVQILMIYFGIPALLSSLFQSPINLAPLAAGIIACSLNSSAYVAEIIRGGIQSIDSGQMEAARSLGMNHFQSMRYIILPQAFRNIIPPMGNEFIVLLKDSSLLMVLGVNELMMQGKLYAAATYAHFPTYIAIASVYLVMTFTISRFVAYFEKRI
ncbi:MAG: amino acid ABC transporter permease [Lentisphaeria bacterium]